MLRTSLTTLFGIEHPIILGPMGTVAGAGLAAAVSNAGGLGLVGGGYGDAAWLQRELAAVKQQTDRPWGAGLITWAASPAVVELVLGFKPHAMMLSFGDPRPYAPLIRAAGCKLICQVQSLADARIAHEAGADIIVAQGTEAGGHSGVRGTLPLVPAVVDAVSPTPVVAAGGIADGRGLAAALMLGAHGALLGTRFYASSEAIGHENAKRRLVTTSGDATARTTVFDDVRKLGWPRIYQGRAIRNRFLERCAEGSADVSAHLEAYQDAVRRGDFDTAVVWAGEALDLITGIEAAGALVKRIAAEAEAQLRRGSGLVSA